MSCDHCKETITGYTTIRFQNEKEVKMCQPCNKAWTALPRCQRCRLPAEGGRPLTPAPAGNDEILDMCDICIHICAEREKLYASYAKDKRRKPCDSCNRRVPLTSSVRIRDKPARVCDGCISANLHRGDLYDGSGTEPWNAPAF